MSAQRHTTSSTTATTAERSTTANARSAPDGGLPNSMLCRIDRASFDWTVRVFPWERNSLFGSGGVVVEGWGGRREVDPLTLELQPTTG